MILDWLLKVGRRITTYLMLALYNTEKTSLSQQGNYMGEDVGHYQSVNQGTMLDDLINGRVTQEVKTTATVLKDGEDLTEQYRMADLDERYENKEERDENSSSSYVIQF